MRISKSPSSETISGGGLFFCVQRESTKGARLKMIEFKTFFERCYMINLDRRPDRWAQIQRDMMPSWPLAAIERWSAIDGRVVTPPAWWKTNKGAWGCYRSHAGIIEKCLTRMVADNHFHRSLSVIIRENLWTKNGSWNH